MCLGVLRKHSLRNSRGHITWEDVSNGLALVVGMGYQILVP